MSFANFVVIQHQLLLKSLSIGIPIWLFAIFAAATIAPLAIVLGWLDFKRVSVPVETELSTRANPWARDVSSSLSDIAKALEHLTRGEVDEAVNLLKRASQRLSRWTGRASSNN